MADQLPENKQDIAFVTSEGPQTPLTPAQIFWYSLANLGCGVFYSFNNFVLPLFLKQYTSDARILGLMGSSHSIEGAVIQPLVGSYSDRLRAKLGRRRPLMLIFTPLSALFLLLTPAAGHLPASARLGAIILCIFLFTVFFNIVFDPYQALMPDITPVSQRGRVTGIWTLLGVLGQAGILLMDLPLVAKFGLVAVISLVTIYLTCAMIKEPPPDGQPKAHRSHFQEIKEALRGLATLRQAGKGLASFFFAGVGIGAVLPNLTLFVTTITHANDHDAQMMPLILMASTALGALPFGKLCDHIGAKKTLLIGLGLIGIASVNGLWVQNLAQISIVMVIAGLGNAARSASAYPLLTETVPAEEVGFYTGLQSTAESIAQPVTVIIVGTLINQGSYRAIFAVCAASIVVAWFILASVRLRSAVDEIAARNKEQGRAA